MIFHGLIHKNVLKNIYVFYLYYASVMDCTEYVIMQMHPEVNHRAFGPHAK